MSGLRGEGLSSTYKSLLRVDDNANGVDSVAEAVTDGEGTPSAIRLCDDQFHIRPQNDDTTALLSVRSKGGTSLFSVDGTNSVVKAGVGAFNVLTQYAYFGVGAAGITSANAAGYHYPLYFGGPNGYTVVAASSDQINIFGNGADPATSVTTADASDQRASELVQYMMYIPDNIYVDSVTSLEGADAATGDTTRFHLMSYTFNSGSTSCLASGVVVASSDNTTNAGSEQIYKSDWNMTSDNQSVAAGKVLICTFEADGANSDYSYQAIIKYHLV